jgi:hypothetical protein
LRVLVMTACGSVDQAAEASHRVEGVEGNLATVTHLTSLERVREETKGWDCRAAIASASAAQPEEI